MVMDLKIKVNGTVILFGNKNYFAVDPFHTAIKFKTKLCDHTNKQYRQNQNLGHEIGKYVLERYIFTKKKKCVY